jgi:hypothetical protein
MENISNKELKIDQTCKIYFPHQTFGKPTKSRKEDPNMFELLSWSVDGF